MILEVAILNVISGKKAEFKLAFNTTEKVISSIKGYVSHQLQQSIKTPNRYIY